MIRNLKVLGLALVAVLAMSVVGASAASAAVEFHSDSKTGNTLLEGQQLGNHVFDAAGSTITCKKATFAGTQTGNTALAIKTSAIYSECSFFGVPTEVNMNGCEYEFKANGEVAVVSKSGKNCATEPITFRASFLGVSCDVKVGSQTGLKTATYDGATTVASPVGDVVVTPAVTGISYTAEGSGCSKTGAQTDGNYTSGPTTVRGYEDTGGVKGAQTPIWVA